MDDGAAKSRSGVALGVALVVFAAFVWRLDFLVDDAFISLRYGRNWARGAGLVFNPGEAPPVEGFTNFLWVAYGALIELFGLDAAVWVRVAGVASGAALVVLVARVVRRVSSELSVQLPALALFAALPPVAMWATGGLETMSFALAVFGVFERLLAERNRPRAVGAGLWAALACLLRADGFVWVGMALVAAALASWRERNAALKRAIAVAGGFALVTSFAYLAFRYAYFGELAPNTARVKVHVGSLSLERGACYVASLLLCVVPLPFAIAIAASRARREPSGLALPSLVVVLASFAYLIVVGGDWMMGYRMLVPALPFCALLAATALASVSSAAVRVVAGSTAVVLAALPSFDVHVVPQRVRELAHFRWSQEFRSEYAMWKKGVADIGDWIELGRAVALHTKPGESMVLGNIGAIGYHASELVIHDTQGLTNKKPFAPVDPNARVMPGHDRVVTIDTFDADEPTYFAAKLVDANDPYATIPAKWRDPTSDAAKKFELRVHALDPAQGFRPGKALLLAAYRR